MMGKVLSLPSRCVRSIPGRVGRITGQFQPSVIRTFMRPVLIAGGHTGLSHPGFCLDRSLPNALPRTDVFHVVLKRKTTTASQDVIRILQDMETLSNLIPLFIRTWKEKTGRHRGSGVGNTFLPGLLRLLRNLQGHPLFPLAVN